MFAIISITILLLIIMIPNSKKLQKTIDAPQTNLTNLEKIITDSGAKGIAYLSYNNKSAAIIDEDRDKLFIYNVTNRDKHNQFKFNHTSFNLNDIIESELIVDDQIITKTSRGEQIGGAIVGGVLLGGVGAIIGGLSGSKNNIKRIKNIEIKLTINDLHNPIHKINFLNNETDKFEIRPNGFKQEHYLCKNALEQAEKWQGMFDTILRNNNN